MALERITASKRAAVAARSRARPLATLRTGLSPTTRCFAAALRQGPLGFVLECKHASPSAGVLRHDYDPVAIARAYAPFASAISVLADEPFFGGSLEHVAAVAAAVMKPVLCKDIIVDPYQVYEARAFGADAVLIMMSVLSPEVATVCLGVARELGMDAVVEVRNERELALALGFGATLIGINNRDLDTLAIDLDTTLRLAPQVPASVTLIGESGVASHRDVLRLRPTVDGLLVGSALVRESDIARAVRELVFGRIKVCGLTRPGDAACACAAGACMGGLIFALSSPRVVSLATAREICRAAPLAFVGVFIDAPCELVASHAEALSLAAVQLHGHEDEAYIRTLRKRLPVSCAIWRAVAVGPTPLAGTLASSGRVPGVERLLYDTATAATDSVTYANGTTHVSSATLAAHAAKAGGTGKAFDWTLLPGPPARGELVLAGGLGPANAAHADELGVWALDVNSGVESAAGIKDPDKLDALFAALRGHGRHAAKETA